MIESKKYFIMIVSCIVTILIVVGFVSINQRRLPKYIEDESTTQNTTVSFSGEEIKDLDLGFNITIPELWDKAQLEDKTYYIEKESSSYVSISKLNYNPKVNNYTIEKARENDSKDSSIQLTNFIQNTTSSYQEEYRQITQDGNIFDVVKLTTWTRENILVIEVGINEEYILTMNKYFQQILGSFKWVKPNAIPENYKILYLEQANAEIMFPTNFSYSEKNGNFSSYNESLNFNYFVNTVDDTSDFTNLSQIDYIDSIKGNKSLFSLGTYKNTGSQLYVEATYTNNNTKMYYRQIGISTGSKIYYLVFEIPYANYNSSTQEQINLMTNSFRIFN